MMWSLLQVVGAVLVAVGVFLVWVPAGLVVSGVFCVVFGFAGELAGRRKER